MPVTIKQLREAGEGAASELGGRNAIQRLLATVGHSRLPTIETARRPDVGTVRIYVWKGVPDLGDDLVMVGGPNLENQVNLAGELRADDDASTGEFAIAAEKTTLSDSAKRGLERARDGGKAGRPTSTPRPRLAPPLKLERTPAPAPTLLPAVPRSQIAKVLSTPAKPLPPVPTVPADDVVDALVAAAVKTIRGGGDLAAVEAALAGA